MEKVIRRKIKLNLITDIQDFTRTSQCIAGPVRVFSEDESYCVDGKSLLGLMSLNLSKPVTVEYPASESVYFRDFLSRFAVKEES